MSAGAAAVGLRLRQERLKRGWSQEGLCRGICAASYLSKIEQGRVQAASELLALLMKRMDLPWYGENLPELEGLVERRYAQLLDGEQEAFQDSRAAFSQALETILSSPLAADGLVLDAVDRQNPSDIPAALEPYLDRRQLALLRIVQDREPEAVRLLNLSGENVGKKLMESTRDTRLCALAEDTVRENAPQSDEWTGERVLAVSGAPIRTGGGKSVGAALVISDRTQLRKLEQMRSEFVSNATHELKTPLTAIRGCIETLQEPEMAANPQIVSEMLEIMDVQGERLQALISDMLELSQIESLPQLDGETGSLSKAVEEAADAVRMQAEKREVALHLQIADGVICRAGQERMRRIAQNLIENAVRYNKPGGNVWAEVRAEGTTGVLAVKDDGIGIPEKDLPRICERFYRVDKGRSRSMGGTGLGLAIVKHIVMSMNGLIEVHSKLGEGTEFLVTLPKEAPVVE